MARLIDDDMPWPPTVRRGRWKTVGKTVQKGNIRACHVGRGRPLLVFGGFHGDEPKSVWIALRFCRQLMWDASLSTRLLNTAWVVVTCLNLDGFEQRKRRNARHVDLNRNFPTANWEPGSPRSRMYGGPRPASEPETRCAIKLVESLDPKAIVTIHSISGHRHCNNYDGPGKRLAAKMAKHNGYPVTHSIGYPTPGSFGQWAGRERGIPTITLELPTHHSERRCWDDNREALLAAGL